MKAKPQKKPRQPMDDRSRWLYYEDLKRIYTADAENQQQFEAACSRAKMEAGV